MAQNNKLLAARSRSLMQVMSFAVVSLMVFGICWLRALTFEYFSVVCRELKVQEVWY